MSVRRAKSAVSLSVRCCMIVSGAGVCFDEIISKNQEEDDEILRNFGVPNSLSMQYPSAPIATAAGKTIILQVIKTMLSNDSLQFDTKLPRVIP